ncbi:MAG: hypothetical protein ACYC61_11185 [Isosphaeraceae bacterium]
MAVVMEAGAPPSFEWRRWPETEGFVERLIASALEGNAFAGGLAERMPRKSQKESQKGQAFFDYCLRAWLLGCVRGWWRAGGNMPVLLGLSPRRRR